MLDIFLSGIRENAAFLRGKRADLRIPMRIAGAVVGVLAVAIVVAGCGTAGGGPSPTEEAPPTVTPTVEVHPVHVGLVVDNHGIDDNGMNAAAWAGVQRAVAELPGVEGTYLEVEPEGDDQTAINQLIADGNDVIITTDGVMFAFPVMAAGSDNPDVKFASVNYSFDPSFDDNPFPYTGSNHSGLIFSAQEGAFLAGYLASGMSQTGVVGTFGAVDRKPLTVFMDGYKCGIQYYNEQKEANVRLVGRDFFPLNFSFGDTEESLSASAGQAAKSLMAQGADVIMPIAGPSGRGVAAAVHEAGALMIGVDTDWYYYEPEYDSIYLTSIVKNFDVAVFETIKAVWEGTFTGTDYVGTLANGGIELSEFRDVAVPDELSAELDVIRQGIIDGSIDPFYCLGE